MNIYRTPIVHTPLLVADSDRKAVGNRQFLANIETNTPIRRPSIQKVPVIRSRHLSDQLPEVEVVPDMPINDIEESFKIRAIEEILHGEIGKIQYIEPPQSSEIPSLPSIPNSVASSDTES